MRYISTKKLSPALTLSAAIQQGLAADGGLFIPETLPHFDWKSFQTNEDGAGFVDFSYQLLSPFFKGDILHGSLEEICREALNFPIPCRKWREGQYLLELYHGPTAAFKDIGARFLASCLSKISREEKGKLAILVATSGDTGGAVAAAFYRKKNIPVFILFPKNGVSPLQEQQLTCWGENVHSFRVNGSFDQCQVMVKEVMQRKTELQTSIPRLQLSSANSINIMRLLPQTLYYAYWSCWIKKNCGQSPRFIIPTGNLGNGMGAFWAKAMGFPISNILLACNANEVLKYFFRNGKFLPVSSRKTLANAMDVGNPSNFERLEQFASWHELRTYSDAMSVSDDHIRKAIRLAYQKYQLLLCPHSATAWYCAIQNEDSPTVTVATADAAKFSEVVEPQIHKKISLPDSLAKLYQRSKQLQDIEASTQDLIHAVQGVLHNGSD